MQEQIESALREIHAEEINTQKRCEALIGHARVLVQGREWNHAKTLLRAVLSIDSCSVEALLVLAQCYQATGDDDLAEHHLKICIQLKATDEMRLTLARFYYERQRWTEAKNEYTSLLSDLVYETPAYFEILKNLGNICVHEGNLDAAEEYYHRAQRICPHSDDLQVNYGALRIQKNEFDQALKHFQRAVEINRLNDRAWVGLALIQHAAGEKELGWANLQNGLEINPKNASGIQMMVQWALVDALFERAIPYLKTYLDHIPDDANVSFQLAALFFESHRYGEADVEVERALSLQPQHAEAWKLRQFLKGRLNHA